MRIKSLTAALALTIITPAAATTYQIDASLGYYITGFIETDGATGQITAADVTNYQLTWYNPLPGSFVPQTSVNGRGLDESTLYLGNVFATPDQLYFSATVGGMVHAQLIDNTSFSAALIWQSPFGNYTLASEAWNGVDYEAILTDFSHSNIPIANAVPEPATWALMLFGFVMVAWRRWRVAT
jgi:hypothetical protein